MRAKLLILILVALLAPVCVAADDPSPQIPAAQLDKTPIPAGVLKIRITKLSGSVLKLGNGQLEVDVENASTEFQTFSPQRLSLVNKDNSQVNVTLSRKSVYYAGSLPPYDPRIPATLVDRRIAPGARLKEHFGLTRKVHLPARLYYDEKLIAVITE